MAGLGESAGGILERARLPPRVSDQGRQDPSPPAGARDDYGVTVASGFRAPGFHG